MIIEAARGGHTRVVSLLLRQPRFTETLRNQIMAQRQVTSTTTSSDRVKSTAGKRRLRSNHSQSEISKQQDQKTPHSEIRTSQEDSITPPNWIPQYNPQLMAPQQFQFQPGNFSQPPGVLQSVSLPGSSTNSPSKGFPAFTFSPNSYSNQQPPFVMNQTSPPTSNHADEEKIKGSVQFQGNNKETSDATSNLTYKFGSVGMFPFLPQTVPQPVAQNPNVVGGSYLLPSVFAESPAYSNQERMEAYMKADEILRNHMSQLDYSKQQALMTALESLMVQSEAHRASMAANESTDSKTTSSFNSSHESSQKPELEGSPNTDSPSKIIPDPQVTGPPPWSFTDPSRMPQFAMGVSTVAPSTFSPDKQNPVLPSSSQVDSSHASNITTEKQSVITAQSHVVATEINAPLNTTNSTDTSFTGQSSDIMSMYTSNALNPQNPIHHSSLSLQPINPNQPVIFQSPTPLINHSQLLQPIYSPDLGGFKHLTHHVQHIPHIDLTASEGLVQDQSHPLASSFLLDANFPMDIPPPADLIPDHVSGCGLANSLLKWVWCDVEWVWLIVVDCT